MKQFADKHTILQFIQNKHYGGQQFVYGGQVEDYMREVRGAKGSTTGKRLRELEEDKLLVKEYNDKGYVKYKVNHEAMV